MTRDIMNDDASKKITREGTETTSRQRRLNAAMRVYSVNTMPSMDAVRLMLRQLAGTLNSTGPSSRQQSNPDSPVESTSSPQLQQPDVDQQTLSSKPARKLSGGNKTVKFTDEAGLNMITFAIIPPRNGATDSDQRHIQTEVDCASKADDNRDDFRLCFDQPFGDYQRYRAKLDRQFVCVENVRVADWSAVDLDAPLGTKTAKRNAVVVCSVSVRNVHPVKQVFVRCTDDEWKTFANLPAQRCWGVPGLGYNYEYFCLAINRPEIDSRWRQQTIAAVEFAVCYQVAGNAEYWDNNEGSNYRIEWRENRPESSGR